MSKQSLFDKLRPDYVSVKREVMEQAERQIRHSEDCHITGWHVTPTSSCGYGNGWLTRDWPCKGCECGAAAALTALRSALEGQP